MVRAFLKGNVYRHQCQAVSMDIIVTAVRHANSKRVKLKIQYRLHHSGRLQWTGKGMDQHSDQIRILTKDFQNWTCVGLAREPWNIPKKVIEKDTRDWEALLGEEA